MDPMTHGVIQGGWSYVAAAYGLSWLALLGFTAWALLKARQEAGE